MAVFNRLTDAQIREFSHRGWFAFCPIYLRENGDGVDMEERNGVPAFLLSWATTFQQLLILACTILDPMCEPAFMILVGPPIEGGKS